MNITSNDRAELRLFERYLARRAEDSNEPFFVTYGECVFEDDEASPSCTRLD